MIRKVFVWIACLIAATQATIASAGDFKKTAGIINVDNNTFYEDADVIAATIDNYIMEELEKNCPDIILRKMKKQPEQDRQHIALSGRALGANAVITGTLTDIRGTKEELGFWFFESLVYYAEVHILIGIYDTETAAMLLMASFEDEIEIDENQFESLQSKSASGNLPDVTKSLEYLSEKIAEAICDTLKDEPFKAYISSFDVNNVTIASGGNAGLKEGVKLIIHGVQEEIKGSGGDVFYFPGSKTGELEITSVSPERSEGRVISGYVDAAGTCVKEKKEGCWLWPF